MRWRSASATACSLALLVALAGCGGGDERLPVLTSMRLARLADQVASGKDCGKPLLDAVVDAVNRGEVPRTSQEELLSAANRIAATCSRTSARALAAQLTP